MINIKARTLLPPSNINELGEVTLTKALDMIEKHPWELTDKWIEEDEDSQPTTVKFIHEEKNYASLEVLRFESSYSVFVEVVKKEFLKKTLLFVINCLSKEQTIDLINKLFKVDFEAFYEWAKKEEREQESEAGFKPPLSDFNQLT